MATVLIVVALLLLTMPMVLASELIPISGKWSGGIPTFSDVKKAGTNGFITMHQTGVFFEGDIDGTFVMDMERIHHYNDKETVKALPESAPFISWLQIPAEFNAKAYRTVEGTVLGYTGALFMRLECKGTLPAAPPHALEGTWVIISGTGELANLHGQGTWWNEGSGEFGYEGQVHFDP